MSKKNESINSTLSKLSDIIDWFDQQENVDVEEGLKKVRAGAVLIKNLKNRLRAVENEFMVVKKELVDEDQNQA